MAEPKLDYADVKAIIRVEDENGDPVHELTTWRGDVAQDIIDASLIPFDLMTDGKLIIVVQKNEKDDDEETQS